MNVAAQVARHLGDDLRPYIDGSSIAALITSIAALIASIAALRRSKRAENNRPNGKSP